MSLHRTCSVLVIETYASAQPGHPHDISHYGIRIAPVDGDAHCPTQLFVTRELACFEAAMAVEAAQSRVDVIWHFGRDVAGRQCRVLDRFEEASEWQLKQPHP